MDFCCLYEQLIIRHEIAINHFLSVSLSLPWHESITQTKHKNPLILKNWIIEKERNGIGKIKPKKETKNKKQK